MLESDGAFREQFDRSSENFHGKDRPEEYLKPVPLNGAKIPEKMEAHRDWKKLALRKDEPAAPLDLGPEHAAACKLRDDLLKLKKCLIALCSPLEAVVKANDKLAEIETFAATEKAAPISKEDLATLEQMPDFVPKDEFEGARSGFSFKLGPQGTGYYNMSKEMKAMEAGAARSQKAVERKRKTLQKQVDQATKRLETQAVAELSEQLFCVDGTKFRLRKKIEALIKLALAGGMSLKTYREDWSVQQKRLTEQIFRYHSVDMLAEIKALKNAAGFSLVVPLETTTLNSTAETNKENAAPEVGGGSAKDAVPAPAAAPAATGGATDGNAADLTALRKEEQVLEKEIKALAIAKDAALSKFEAEAAAKEERLRVIREDLVKGGHYKSHYQAVLKES